MERSLFLTRRTLTCWRKLSTCATKNESLVKVPVIEQKSHNVRLKTFFDKNPRLGHIKKSIPEKYLTLKRSTPRDSLYLIDPDVATKAVSYILPIIKTNRNQIISETNAGLGLIATELLKSNVELVRIYESCTEFKPTLKNLTETYEGHVELFNKNIFLLHRYEKMDKEDHGNRIEQLLNGVLKKKWADDPVMTVIGALPNMNFIRFLMKSLVLQNQVISLGRIDLFLFMRPRDYVILTAGPHLNLHTYQYWSVLFNLFFNYELLSKFPREVFLPWQSKKVQKTYRYPETVDPDMMYFVRISFKKQLPLPVEELLSLYIFIIHCFGKGTKRVIPTVEKLLPGSGLNIMVPELCHEDYVKDINIFTRFGDLTPIQILGVFKETSSNPAFKNIALASIKEYQLIKTETIDSSMEEHLEKDTENVAKNRRK